MAKSVRFLAALLAFAFVLIGMPASPAMAQEKGKATVKVLLDNDKVRVTENHYRPGDVGEEDRSQYRVNRTLQGGTLERIYPDGKKEKLELKTGQVRFLEPSKGGNYKVMNVGKTTVINYVVRLK
jgi:hypothetical protein